MDTQSLNKDNADTVLDTASELKDSNDENLSEGELYVMRKGHLERIPRNDDDNMRKVRITEEAYERLMTLSQTMRKTLHGYKPDPALIASALLLKQTDDQASSQEAIRQFVIRLFSEQ